MAKYGQWQLLFFRYRQRGLVKVGSLPEYDKSMASAVHLRLGGSMKTFSAYTLVAWLTVTCSAATKLAPDLSRQNGQAPLDVIVQFTSPPTARHHPNTLTTTQTLPPAFSA